MRYFCQKLRLQPWFFSVDQWPARWKEQNAVMYFPKILWDIYVRYLHEIFTGDVFVKNLYIFCEIFTWDIFVNKFISSPGPSILDQWIEQNAVTPLKHFMRYFTRYFMSYSLRYLAETNLIAEHWIRMDLSFNSLNISEDKVIN